MPRLQRSILGRIVVTVAAAFAVGAPLTFAAPAAAQLFSQGYQFLQAVRERDGTKATEILNGPSGTIINSRDPSSGQTGLHIVVARRDTVWLRFLLQKGADANLADREGVTPLMIAATVGYVDGAQALLDGGARIGQTNGRGETALHRAVQNRDLAMVRALIAAGADADAQDSIAGMSPRDYAQRDNRAGAVLAALDEGNENTATPAVAGPN